MTKNKIDTGTDHLLAEMESGVLTITLNRPEARNAMSKELVLALVDQLKDAQQNSDVKCVVLTGAGKGFCAGGDVKSVHLSGPFSKLKSEFFSQEYSLNLQIKKFPKPYLSIWQ